MGCNVSCLFVVVGLLLSHVCMGSVFHYVGAPRSKGLSKGSGPKQTVPTNDPVVMEAAEHTLRMLNLGSNSLSPFELSEIVSAEAEVRS